MNSQDIDNLRQLIKNYRRTLKSIDIRMAMMYPSFKFILKGGWTHGPI